MSPTEGPMMAQTIRKVVIVPPEKSRPSREDPYADAIEIDRGIVFLLGDVRLNTPIFYYSYGI